MIKIKQQLQFGHFYNLKEIPSSRLKFAVIAAIYDNKLIFVKHKNRNTLELPGGKKDKNETIDAAASRELVEETGAKDFTLYPIKIYSIKNRNSEYCGKFYFAEIHEMGELPNSEIESVFYLNTIPEKLTYPNIQPHLTEEINRFLKNTKKRITY